MTWTRVSGWTTSRAICWIAVFISRWDAAVASKTPDELHNQLGIAIAKRTYKAARALLGSPRWARVYNLGARPQCLLWTSTGTKDLKVNKAVAFAANFRF